MNSEAGTGVPTRETIDRWWRSLIDASVTREQVHGWVKPWVEERDDEIEDPLVLSGLQRLHGFDMVYTDPQRKVIKHGGPGTYVHAESDIASAYTSWRNRWQET